jgi:hypothetical protein
MSDIKANKDNNNETESYTINGKHKTCEQAIKEVKDGKHPGYHVREMNGKEFIASNPDNKSSNNVNR